MILLPSRYCDFSHAPTGRTHASNRPLWTVWKQTDHSPTPSQPLRVYFAPPLPFPHLSMASPNHVSSDADPVTSLNLKMSSPPLQIGGPSSFSSPPGAPYSRVGRSLREQLPPQTARDGFIFYLKLFRTNLFFYAPLFKK